MIEINIEKIKAREIIDSRGNPTVEVDINNTFRAMVPSGASTGQHEAHELRDKDPKRYGGKGVLKAVSNINTIIGPKIQGMDVTQQEEIDRLMIELDSSENKDNLGANAILAVSTAVCKAGAAANNIPLYQHIQNLSRTDSIRMPVPCMNVINGGKHAGLENDAQETMLMPVDADSFSEAMRMGCETYHLLAKKLKEQFGPSAIHLGDEGGFAPPLKNLHDRLEFLTKVFEETGYGMGIALDCASSEFYYDGIYKLNGKDYQPGELIDYYKELISTYKVLSIEDGMAEDDWDSWTQLNLEIGGKVQIVGDDLLVTNVKRIETGIEKKAANALLLKINQIGSITESIEAAKKCYNSSWNVMVSHRSGETEDSFIADLSVGIASGQIKTGAPARSERLAKYNQLMRIEEETSAHFAGDMFR